MPLDVRVLDERGRPVTDLAQSDFTVLEDGRPRRIDHFSSYRLEPIAPTETPEPLRLVQPLDDGKTPPGRRVFLIVLGTGNHQRPFKAIDHLATFVREKLMPQDQVAVLAFGRATDFTTDHGRIGDVLARLGGAHDDLTRRIGLQYQSGDLASSQGPAVPSSILREIDTLFAGLDGSGFRHLGESPAPDGKRMAEDYRRRVDEYFDASVTLVRMQMAASAGQAPSQFDALTLERSGVNGMSFGDYVARTRTAFNDVALLYSGINYLRYISGEKHVIYLTPFGLMLPRAENDESVAGEANRARVTLNVIQTGGHGAGAAAPTLSVPIASPGSTTASGRMTDPAHAAPIRTSLEPMFQRFSIGAIRTLADLTGGQAWAYGYADDAVDRLLTATSAGYLLGYTASDERPGADGYRRLEVRVNRKGVRVLHRRGYAVDAAVTLPDRQRQMAYTRLTAAINATNLIPDVRLSDLRATTAMRDGRPAAIDLSVTIAVSALGLREEAGFRVGQIDVSIMAQTRSGDPAGNAWERFDLRIPESDFARVLKDGARFTTQIPISARASDVKVVVYANASDRLGSALIEVR